MGLDAGYKVEKCKFTVQNDIASDDKNIINYTLGYFPTKNSV